MVGVGRAVTGKRDLTIEDFHQNPVWYFDEEADAYFPVVTLEERVASIDDFRFPAKITTKAGDVLDGCISGLGDFSISVYRNDRWYAVNKHWVAASIAQIEALIADSPEITVRSLHEFFPVGFETMIGKEPFIDRVGEFDLLERGPLAR